MKKKMLAYAFLPVLGLSLVGVNAASAHGMFGGLGSATPEEIATRHTKMFEQEANILGLSVDEVKAAWAEGKNLQELAKEKGIKQEDIQARMKAAALERMKDQLSALVDKGVITQAQADKRLEVMQNKMQNVKGKMKVKHRGMKF